jgi:four helix bundle protein
MAKFAESFRDLEVYQNALQLTVDVHEFCKTLPREELFVLASQMRRASRSVCGNISEAWRKRRYKKAFVSKLNDAETEASEMQNWIDVSIKLEYMAQNDYVDFDKRYEHIISQLVIMINEADRWCL